MNDSYAIRKRGRKLNGRNRILSNAFRELEVDLEEHIQFFQSFIREPASVGALSPSSRALARAMIAGLPLETADLVVEIGPGTGAFTGLIRERIGKKTTFITVELDRIHARNLKRRFPGLTVYNDSAERVPDYLALHGHRKANCIISGLPWASFPRENQERIMNGLLASLEPNGILTTFAYLHARWLPQAVRFRRNLEQNFSRVETSPVVWKNLPPAFVYRCSQAITAG